MKTLLLARHAKSDWSVGLADHDRPLNERGMLDAPRMGAELRERGPVPDAIVTSTATRARLTAAALAEGLGLDPEPATRIDRALYLAGPAALLEVAQTHDDADDVLMLVAHNPGMSELASLLAGREIEMPTCAIVEVAFDVDHWTEAAPGAARVVRVDTPR